MKAKSTLVSLLALIVTVGVTSHYSIAQTVSIRATNGAPCDSAIAGQNTVLSLLVEDFNAPLGGFDFLVEYDASGLSFVDAVEGADFQWEYFTFRTDATLPPSSIQLVGVADLINGHSPDSTDFYLNGEAVRLEFAVTADSNGFADCYNVGFAWEDCGSNLISSKYGDSLYASTTTFPDSCEFDSNGAILPIVTFQPGCICTGTLPPPGMSPTVSLTALNGAPCDSAVGGQNTFMSVNVDGFNVPLGGFDFLVEYDASGLSFVDAVEGADFNWEYFSFSTGPPAPLSTVQLVGVADLNNGQSLDSADFFLDGEAARLEFAVTTDSSTYFDCYSVGFTWEDCGSNLISSKNGETVYASTTTSPDSCGTDSNGAYLPIVTYRSGCICTGNTSPPLPPPTVSITAPNGAPCDSARNGQSTTISVLVDGFDVPLGGFDFLIGYDAAGLSFIDAAKGADFHWEYFSYRTAPVTPPATVRLIGIADLSDGNPLDSMDYYLDGEAARLEFDVTSDTTGIGACYDVGFTWEDCRSNALASKDGNTLYVYSLIDGLCLVGDSNGTIQTIVNFQGGCVCVMPDDSLPCSPTGDVVDPLSEDVVNVIDVIAVIDYAMRSQYPSGVDMSCGDVDCSGTINILDIVHMIDYVFRSGPPLSALCPR